MPSQPKQGTLTEGQGSVQLTSWLEHYLLYYKTNYLHQEVNCTEPPPLVKIPWTKVLLL